MDKIKGSHALWAIAKNYFHYMASRYPVMCLSDEFYFFPRAHDALKFLDRLDSLNAQKIKDDVIFIKSLKDIMASFTESKVDLEASIDLKLLTQSMLTFLREFDTVKIWKKDPTLYLKIIALGIEQIVSRLTTIKINTAEMLVARLTQIPRLLKEAKHNLGSIPQGYLEVSLEFVDCVINYFKTLPLAKLPHGSLAKETIALAKKSLDALGDFKNFLTRSSPQEKFIKNRQLLTHILQDSFSYHRSLEEIFSIASREYRSILKELKRTAKKIHLHKSWQEMLREYSLNIRNTKELLNLYAHEIKKLKKFLTQTDIITLPKTQNISVRLTPPFMKPIRASASYSAPLTKNNKEHAYFYITPGTPRSAKFLTTVHNEFIFVTAHETYPGHHLLDSVRRNLKNPVRAQIESPFFYEGWASYAEHLIDSFGYISSPLQKLVGLRRKAWRAVRAMLDVGVRINKITPRTAAGLLTDLGYESRLVALMLRHYLLTPGYQLCYTIGTYEIDLLKKRYASQLGLKKFHEILLEGGQIPFQLIERRLRAQ